MNSILTNNNKFFKTIVNKSDYWDFKIAMSKYGGAGNIGLDEDCLSAYIDTTFNECVDSDKDMLLSSSNDKHLWKNAVNNGLTLNNIGFTGVDNCSWADNDENALHTRLKYNKFDITNDEFIKLFVSSKLTVESDDFRLKLTGIDGNNGIFYYPEITYDEVGEKKIYAAKLNGNFFQGVFKYGNGCDYSILPSKIDDGWCLEFCIMKKDFEEPGGTLNLKHPDNKGTFFYIGPRSENKWWKYYNVETEFPESGNTQPDEHIPENENIVFETGSGVNIKSANFIQIDTNNGFLIYDRTDEGLTSKDVSDEEHEAGVNISLEMRKNVKGKNFFQYVNRTENGYTSKNISELECEDKQKYDVLKDLYENALSFFISENGCIGYKYYTKDCDCGAEDNIVTEFSNENIIELDKWYVIDVRVQPNSLYNTSKFGTPNTKSEKMRLMFYVNGALVLVSKDLPILKLRQLDENPEKQEGVAYNISIGGGTQGLCDVIYPDYKKLPEYILPLEKNFCGSFIGYFKSFKFYTCDKNYEQINNNVQFEGKDLNLEICWDNIGNVTKDLTKKDGVDEYTLEKLFGNLSKNE